MLDCIMMEEVMFFMCSSNGGIVNIFTSQEILQYLMM